MKIKEQYESQSSFFVFDKDLNYAKSLFGGKIMAEADCEAAKVARNIAFACNADNAVTVNFNMEFIKPAETGDLININAKLHGYGNTSITVDIEVTKTNKMHLQPVLIGRGVATFVIMKNGYKHSHHLNML